MKISLNWLKQYIDLPADLDPKELALKLTMSTVEVEKVIDQRQKYQQMVIGEIVDITDHPQAEKLKVCKVNAGKGRKLQVICGATNIYNGMKGILALPGAMVKWHGQSFVKLDKIKIRGVESEGMFCASSEIDLADEFKEEAGVIDLQGQGEAGQPVTEALGFDDVIFEIDNKSITHRPDLWGHYGIAREAAALLGLKLKELKLEKIKENNQVPLKIVIEDKENCYRYLGVVVGQLKVEPSPVWLQRLLRSVDLRPINNIVDLTNFVMLELGRPAHAFDRRQITADTIIVRRAAEGEKFTTLDGKLRVLSSEMCLVCDAASPVDLAGIMGGENSEIRPETTEIILELANFNPVNIRQTAAKLGLRTEAAIRFEKSLDPALAEVGLRRIIALIKEIIPEAQIMSKLVEVNYQQEESRKITLDLDFLNRRLGLIIPKKEVVKILESLAFKVTAESSPSTKLALGEQLIVEPPSFRVSKDISLAEDLIEEVARIYGYHKITPQMPALAISPPEVNEELLWERKVKDLLTSGLGATEVSNYSFTAESQINLIGLKPAEHLSLKNSISPEQRYLRLSLFENLLANLESNLRFFDNFNLFELGRVFVNQPGHLSINNRRQEFLPQQEKYLAGLKVMAEKDLVFYQVKGLVEVILENLEIDYQFQLNRPRSLPWIDSKNYLEIRVADQPIGWLGQLSQEMVAKLAVKGEVGLWEFNFSQLLKYAQDKKQFQPLPKYPGIIYDLSLMVPKTVRWLDIQKEVLEASPLVVKVELFDVYELERIGPDKKSLAFHIYFQSQEKTLTASEAEKLRSKIVAVLNKKFKAQAR